MTLFSDRRGGLESILHRPRPSLWNKFLRQPCIFLAQNLYYWRPYSPSSPASLPVSIVCISDTHNSQPSVPDGDVLIHAGDLSQSGTFEELSLALEWIASQSHPIKIVVAGNHDLLLDRNQDGTSISTKNNTIHGRKSPEELRSSLPWNDIIYLCNEETTITCPNGRRLHVYGSPLSPRHGNWAFQYQRRDDVWRCKVPDETDILITHAPPRGHCDLLGLGCVHLLRELWRVRPLLHVFGHVHEGAGVESVDFNALQGAFEKTVTQGGGIWNLMCTFFYFILTMLWRPGPQGKGRRCCTLVNAAMVGGLRDTERRKPVTVVI